MLTRIAAFEFRYLLKNPLLWMTAAAVFMMPFASLALGLNLEEDVRVFKNSPYEVVSKYTIISCLFMFATTVFVSNIVLRDDETEFGPILRSTGITKFDYLFGRFLGAMAVVALCLALVTPGIWLGALMPWVDPTTVGPNRIGDHLYAYFLIALPNVLITGSIFFALATVSRSMMGTYLGLVGFLGLYFTLLSLLGSKPELVQSFAIAEPFANRAFDDATRFWTTPQRNSSLPSFSGALLYNRLLWIGISIFFLAIAWFGFDFASSGGSRRRRRKRRMADMVSADAAVSPLLRPLPAPEHGRSAAWALLAVRTRFEVKQVLKSPAFILLMAWATFTALFVLITQRDPDGRPAHPLTVTLIPELEEIFFILPLVIVIIYAGELVWRERDRRMHEIMDAAPHPNWAYIVPKAAAIALVLVSIFAASTAAAVAVQLSLGFTRVELGTYLLWYVLPMTWDAMLVAALAVFVQALSPHKFIGWGIMILYLGANFTGFTPDHNLLNYGGHPPVEYSDMDGVTSFWEGPWVFRLYWGALAVLLLVAAHLLWRRGTETRLKPRLRLAATRLVGAPRIVAAGALLTFAATGAYAFYNTNVLNRYETPEAKEAYWAEYERRYMKYDRLPQPSISHVKLDVALHPEERRATVKGAYLLRNLEDQPIRDVHVLLRDRELKLAAAAVAGGRLAFDDPKYGYRIFRLDRPMAPGETRVMTFETQRWHRGFPNGAPNTRIVENGTFLSNDELLPVVGMNGEPKVISPAARREHGLPPLPGLASLDDLSATKTASNERSWTTADITLSTVAGQTPIAPGKKVSDVTQGGRRTARFVSDAPIRSSFAVQSARYAQRNRRYRNIDLAVYHHPGHAWNVDHMLNMLEASLAYFEANFGPYQFDQARVIEFPSYSYHYAQAFANTIPNAETLGFLADLRSPGALDYVAGLMAHELAHQYWAHQLTPADMEGGAVLTETLAQYSAIMVMREVNGEDQIRRQLRMQLNLYLSGRAWEKLEEVPLVRVGHQRYIMYNKGALAMYLLQERLGEDAVNRALRTLLEKYKFKGAPYARSTDLVEALRAEAKTAEDQALITDLFERITLYDLKATSPEATRRPDGKWEVTVPVEARKFYADAEGAEKETPLADRFEIGLFTAEPGSGAFDRRHIVLMQRQPIRSGRQVLTFVVDRKPTHAGIDPYNFYIDRNSADNLVPVQSDGT